MSRVYLAVDDCFASKRWVTPILCDRSSRCAAARGVLGRRVAFWGGTSVLCPRRAATSFSAASYPEEILRQLGESVELPRVLIPEDGIELDELVS